MRGTATLRGTLLLLCLFAAAFASPAPVAAQRILALTPHACEILYAIGAGSRLVGGVAYCDYPAEAGELPRVGSYERINVEAALRLRPDVAVVMSRNVVGVEALEKMGVAVVVSNPVSFATMFDDILKLGELTGQGREAGDLVGQLRRRLQKVRAGRRSAIPVFYEVWHDPMLTAGGAGFISDLIHEAGGRNIFAAIDAETPRVNVEAVIRARPEVMILPLEESGIAGRRAYWEQWLGRGRVRFVAIDPDLLHRPGPRLLDGLEMLQQALHGDRGGCAGSGEERGCREEER